MESGGEDISSLQRTYLAKFKNVTKAIWLFNKFKVLSCAIMQNIRNQKQKHLPFFFYALFFLNRQNIFESRATIPQKINKKAS